MSMITIPYFGEIDLSSIEEYYETEIELGGKKVELDLCFEDSKPDQEWFKHFAKYAQSLDKMKKNIRGNFIKYSEEGLIKEFIAHHLEDAFDAEELNEILSGIDDSLPDNERILLALKVDKIVFYPQEDNFAVWDFTFTDLSDEILVVITDEEGEIIEFTWES